MSKNRWKAVRSALAFGPSDDASFDRDEWCFIDPMVTAFNEQMADVVNPGWLLCVDETMSAWRGKQGKRDSKKCPKLSWVPRKPEPLGTELKTAGCALSGMIITIEICKGKETHKDLEFFKEKSRFDGSEYGHTTATTLRLIKPWFGTQRVLGGDSWFASVKTAEACAERGTYFVGDVKTATRRFCGAALDEATGHESGAWATYTSELKLGGNKTACLSTPCRIGEARACTSSSPPAAPPSRAPPTWRPSRTRRTASMPPTTPSTSSRASARASSTTGRSPSRASTGTTATGSSSWAWRSG